MKTLLISALLDSLDDLSTVIYNVFTNTLSALKKRNLKILLNHFRQNSLSYFFTLLLPLVQASLYMLDLEALIILIILTLLNVLKKMVHQNK